MIDEKKIAQVAAFFLNKADGPMDGLKLNKLMYLADRESLRQDGCPITHDQMLSWSRGPILGGTKKFIDGDASSELGVWKELVSKKVNDAVSLKVKIEDRNFYRKLGQDDLELLDSIWDEFGHMSADELSDYMHRICTEWDHEGASTPISYKKVLTELGYSEENAGELEGLIKSYQNTAVIT